MKDALGQSFDANLPQLREIKETAAFPRLRRHARYVTPRDDIKDIFVREGIGFGGPTQVLRPLPRNLDFIRLLNTDRFQYVSNCRTIIYEGRRFVAEIPAQTLVEVLSVAFRSFYIRHFQNTRLNNADTPYAIEQDMILPGTLVLGGTFQGGPWFVPPNNYAAKYMHFFINATRTAGAGLLSVVIQCAPVSEPAMTIERYVFGVGTGTTGTPPYTNMDYHPPYMGLHQLIATAPAGSDFTLNRALVVYPPGDIFQPQDNTAISLNPAVPLPPVGHVVTRVHTVGDRAALADNPGIAD